MPYTVSTKITSGSYNQSPILFFLASDTLTTLTRKQAKKLFYHLAIHPDIFSEIAIHPIRKEGIPEVCLYTEYMTETEHLLHFHHVDRNHLDLFHQLSDLFDHPLFGYHQ
jgi:hypothetical protein